MKRLHLFEFEDQPWLPSVLRKGVTAYLRVAYQTLGIHSLWAGELSDVLRATGCRQIVDLGSGDGGPVEPIVNEVRLTGMPVSAILTDRYPRTMAFDIPGVTYCPDPVEARSIPTHLKGCRTLFASFHHCQPDDAAAILANAARDGAPICVFEATSRSALALLWALLIPILVLLLTPRIRPLHFAQLLFTYLMPVLPAIIFWDGLVSHFRTYSPSELLAMARRRPVPAYQWRAGAIPVKGLPQGLPFLIGQPRIDAGSSAVDPGTATQASGESQPDKKGGSEPLGEGTIKSPQLPLVC